MCFDFGVFRRTRTSLLNLSTKTSELWEAQGAYIEGPYFLFSGGHIVGLGRGCKIKEGPMSSSWEAEGAYAKGPYILLFSWPSVRGGKISEGPTSSSYTGPLNPKPYLNPKPVWIQEAALKP